MIGATGRATITAWTPLIHLDPSVKILIVGNGGREHALLWKLRRDAPDADFFITRGNGGTAGLATPLPFDPGEFQPLAGWAESEGVDLTVVGPEKPLAEGVADHFLARGLPVFGPTSAAAEIESSKAFAKRLMERNGIPTAAHRSFASAGEAGEYILALERPPVVKASGLAAGKGAVVCDSHEQALLAARDMLSGEAFGGAGSEVVVEERMEGEELSVFALTDGETVIPLLGSQDHKRIGEGDTGPNTGGMGAYAPVSTATPELMERLEREILRPIVAALAGEERRFRGLLYAGVMLTGDGPKVVEFNCRFGDPETQAVIPLLESSLLEPMLAIARQEPLAGYEPAWRPGVAVTTVLAAGGYPGSYQQGQRIEIPAGLEEAGRVIVFHAGTVLKGGSLFCSGGRVLAVTAVADGVAGAAELSRERAGRIFFEGVQFRKDIAWREVARARAS